MENIKENLLRLYARSYIERDAELLLDHLCSIILYSRQSPTPKIMERHNFINFLDYIFQEQTKTSNKFCNYSEPFS